ncbi:S-layer homology domain-containing protein, partial [Oculatella sp. LEGE 06141]|uniref:S-layer homology domain-containing protein n=1 Tax=Oculatella sp. LEGE 06141 TaxID=1828648 RepID=UPI00187F2C62
PTPTPTPTPSPTPAPATSFRDIGNDIYAGEIRQAVQLGFISGFPEDNTFRPQTPLTREQLVSMVLESLRQVPNANVTIPTQTSTNPFSDVNASRWSAAKIQFARNNNIISGYQDGTFRPTQPVTRAEMMAVLRRTAEYARTLQGRSTTLEARQQPRAFSDTSGHWANSLITQMSTYCGVASPVNETGTTFAPNSPAQRNYAAAATLRMVNCVRTANQ